MERAEQQTTGGNGAEIPAQERSERERAREGMHNVRTLVSHFTDLAHEATSLVRDEAALARAEISEDIDRLKAGGASLAVAGSFAFAGFLILLVSAVAALALVWPVWLAALVVGGGALIIGLIAAAGARAARPKKLKPGRTMDSARSISHTTREAMR